ncbi:hypothetical protein CFC21_112452 [Triticum aestivum]|uniref:Uncharacterized protein n=3 Tax=Triticum TaxID=4564 RepID=A0A9R0GKZ2_WHEAT|nr:hypothetical protein CFC21_081992 [Triticum aestivum]MBC2899633.1 hypothetical protein [Triticum aestivum]VAI42437.1 unnamed protein product [Triticum turgidum subsp. durum]
MGASVDRRRRCPLLFCYCSDANTKLSRRRPLLLASRMRAHAAVRRLPLSSAASWMQARVSGTIVRSTSAAPRT